MRTLFIGIQASVDILVGADDDFIAGIASLGSHCVFWPFASANAVFMARLTFSVMVIFSIRTLFDAKGTVFGVFTFVA